MSLQVGVHENMVLYKAEKNERGTLIVGFKKAGEINLLDALNSTTGSTNLTPSAQDFLIYPPRIEGDNNQIDTPENIIQKISDIVDPLTHILLQYLPSKDIKWDITAGTGVDNNNIKQKVVQPNVIEKIYANIASQFIKMATPLLVSDRKMRLLLVRQSKAKHYPTLRKRYLSANPFIEPMDVPASKLRFNEYEVKNGLNDPSPVIAGAAPDSKEAAAVDALLK